MSGVGAQVPELASSVFEAPLPEVLGGERFSLKRHTACAFTQELQRGRCLSHRCFFFRHSVRQPATSQRNIKRPHRELTVASISGLLPRLTRAEHRTDTGR